MSAVIARFYDFGRPYFEFSNFFPRPVELDGAVWPTTEHYFQAQKFADAEFRDLIRRRATPPDKEFILAQRKERDVSIRPDWEEVKVGVMRRALRAKFSQHADLALVLLGTGEASISESRSRDAYWGPGADGTGRPQLMLGRLLEETREWLRGQPAN